MSEPEMLLPVLQQIAERLARIEVFLWSESRYFTCEQMEDALSFEEDETAFRWSCDKCGLAVEFPPTNFSGAWAELRMRGWQASKERVEGEWPVWSHRCGKCRKSAASILDQPFRLVK